MKKSNFKITLCLLLTLFLTACVPNRYKQSDKEEVEKKSTELLTEWLNSLPETCELTEVRMVKGNKAGQSLYSGYYKSNFSEGKFTAGGRTCRVLVNNEDGSIWTDYYGIDLGGYIEAELQPICEAYGLQGQIDVTQVFIEYNFVSHGDPEIEVRIQENWLPAKITQETADELVPEFLRGPEVFKFCIDYTAGPVEEFDPRVLMDLLKDKEEANYRDYTVDHYTAEGQKISHGELKITDGMDQAVYLFDGFGREERDILVIEYTEKQWAGKPEDFDPEKIERMACPVKIDGNKLRFDGDSYDKAYLFFTEKPPYQKVVRSYINKEQEPKELSIVQLKDGRWSLTDGSNWYGSGFYFETGAQQEVVLE